MSSSSSTSLDIKEDKDSSADFEDQIKGSQEAYKQKQTSRPTSSNSRPQTATRIRPDSSTQTLSFRMIYDKIQKMIKEQDIDVGKWLDVIGEEIKSSENLYQAFQKLGIYVSESECQIILKETILPIQSGDFYQRILNWIDPAISPKSSQKQLHQQRDEGQDKAAQQRMEGAMIRTNYPNEQDIIDPNIDLPRTQIKNSQKSQKDVRIRPISSQTSNRAKLNRISQKNRSPKAGTNKMDEAMLDKDLELLWKREMQLIGKATNADVQIKKFIQQTKKREDENERAIGLAVDKYRREYEYDCLHKMGEANEIAQQLGSPFTFRALKDQDGTTKCHIYKAEKFFKEISLEAFLREWRRLKRSQKFEETHKQGHQPQQSAKVDKAQRQEELKRVLQETIKLSEDLREQLKILERKGVAFTKISNI